MAADVHVGTWELSPTIPKIACVQTRNGVSGPQALGVCTNNSTTVQQFSSEFSSHKDCVADQAAGPSRPIISIKGQERAGSGTEGRVIRCRLWPKSAIFVTCGHNFFDM